ncbi:hypothetical protein DFJ73DRAFT_963626 [Zopfochytrium polystomum]|nr:hypothetical protein DFJ73DRAFT_963626 [Zopfochytrium polystomum]
MRLAQLEPTEEKRRARGVSNSTLAPIRKPLPLLLLVVLAGPLVLHTLDGCLLASAAVLPPVASGFECGASSAGATCAAGLCCSQWGWCGASADFCGDGCQQQFSLGQCLPTAAATQFSIPPSLPLPITTYGQCGPGLGVCSEGRCCSKWGWCGSTEDFCGAGCQDGYGLAPCLAKPNNTRSDTSPPPAPTSGSACGSGFGTCGEDLCCSREGYCGKGGEYCGPGCQQKFSNGACQSVTSSPSVNPTPTSSLPSPTPSLNPYTPAPNSVADVSTNVTQSSAQPDYVARQCGANLGTCSVGTCCSEDGFCGVSADSCGSGCQPEYGDCDSAPQMSGLGVVYNCTVPNTVAITFDDNIQTSIASLSKAVSDAGGHATFFLSGQRPLCIYDRASDIQAAFLAGHQIASLSWTNQNLTSSPAAPAAVLDEMSRTDAAVARILNRTPLYFRPPLGSYTRATVELARQNGYARFVLWDATCGATDDACDAVDPRGGHIFRQDDADATIAAAQSVIRWAASHGLKMVTVAECLGEDAPPPYRVLGDLQPWDASSAPSCL